MIKEKQEASDYKTEIEMNKKVINNLKYQIADLSKKLQQSMNKCAEAEYNLNRAENNKNVYYELTEKKQKEINELYEKIESLENTLINLNEALGAAKKEISRLQKELQNSQLNSRDLQERFETLLSEKEKGELDYSDQIDHLNTKIKNLEEEKKKLLKILNSQNFTSEVCNNYQKLSDEKENEAKNLEKKLQRFINENAELKRKLSQEESNKLKLNESIKQKKEKNNSLLEEIKHYKGLIDQYSGEVKWNQDMVNQKEVTLKVYKEKITKLEAELNELQLKNAKLAKDRANNTSKSVIGGGINNTEEEVLMKVNAKPFLFGPENEDT